MLDLFYDSAMKRVGSNSVLCLFVVSLTWQDFACSTVFKRQLQTNKTILVLVRIGDAYGAAGCVLHILQVLKTVNLLKEMTRDNPYSLRLSNPSQLTASLFGF